MTRSPYQGVSSTVNDPDSQCLGLQYAGTNCRVASFTTLDLSASYSGFKNWQIFGSVINVFNRIAPYAPAAHTGSSITTTTTPSRAPREPSSTWGRVTRSNSLVLSPA
jgi:outer membrane receptor protein involved in Fe transport